jgi:hypothetical protein
VDEVVVDVVVGMKVGDVAGGGAAVVFVFEPGLAHLGVLELSR